jgi:isopenicillin N synthase-like dioxygenase
MAKPEEAVPIIDISPFVDESAHDDAARKHVAEMWDKAMTDVGFAIIKGHGVAPEVISGLRDGAKTFFSQDASAKLAYNFGPYGNPLGGYTGMGTEAVSRTRDEHGSDGGTDTDKVKAAAADLVESFIFKPESPKPKPESLANVGDVYHSELLRVLGCLHHVTAAALDLPKDFFDPFYTPSASVSLRLAYYPPIPPEAQSSSAVRYGEHTDYTGYTLLHQDESDIGDMNAGGLQVLLKSGEWHALLPQKGAFVVNIGDLYEVWTNGRWRSTVHRVMKPPAGSAAASAPRLSIPFFTGPNDDAVIEAIPTCVDADHPAKYEPVKALDHLLRKLNVSNV